MDSEEGDEHLLAVSTTGETGNKKLLKTENVRFCVHALRSFGTILALLTKPLISLEMSPKSCTSVRRTQNKANYKKNLV